MKRLLIFLLLFIPLTAFAAENLTGLSMSGKTVVVKDGLAFTPYNIAGDATVVNGTIADGESYITLAHTANATILYTPRRGPVLHYFPDGKLHDYGNYPLTFRADLERLKSRRDVQRGW